jgi:DNA-binding CsgD family transcriptional regulator
MPNRESTAGALSAPQEAVLTLSASGFYPAEVATVLRLGVDEVRAHLAGCVSALGARSRLEAVVIALRRRLIRPLSAAQREILGALVQGTILVGTVDTLAQSLEVSVSELRSDLRDLLEAERIAVHGAPLGRLTIRLERRASRALPALPPAIERRRSMPTSGLSYLG